MDYKPLSYFLFKNQRKVILEKKIYKKMNHRDIIRLSNLLCGDIFGDNCISYNGEHKNYLPIISFQGNKVMLQRLLFHNYIGDISLISKRLLLPSCNNKNCCCLKHIQEGGL